MHEMKSFFRETLVIVLAALMLVYGANMILSFTNMDISLNAIIEFLTPFFGLYIFLIALVIFFENKNPSRTLTWLLILALIPYLGLFFYFFFGRENERKLKRKMKKKPGSITYNAALIQRELVGQLDFFKNYESYVNDRLLSLLLKNSDSPFSLNNKVEVLNNGQSTYGKIIKELYDAKDHIHLEYFIIRDDAIGKAFVEVLAKKAREGVAVRVIYDDVGCWQLKDSYWKELREAGGKIYPFLPVPFPFLSRDLNFRNHRKIIVIDGKIGFLGGLNIGDEYLGKKALGFWRDIHLMIKGESIFSLQTVFLNDWHFVSGEEIEGERYYPQIQTLYGKTIMQVTSSGPDTDWKAILQAYFTMISTAEDRIWMATPYLVPDESIMMGLKTAALSGVDVRIIIPNKPDHYFVYWASRDNVEELLEAGVRIYTYENGFIHSKVLMVDGICASIGTANLDYRSLDINFEVNAFIYDHEVVRSLEEDYISDLKESKEILLEEHKMRGIKEKFLESLGRLVSPLQ